MVLCPGKLTTNSGVDVLASNRPLQTFQACSLGVVDGVVAIQSRDIHVHTGWSSPPAGALPTTPRLLHMPVPDIDGGDPIKPPPMQLEVDVTNVRVYSVIVTELYGPLVGV